MSQNLGSVKEGTMELWRKVWRDGVAPLLSIEALRAFRFGLQIDDPKLIQGATTDPPPLQCVQDWEPKGACALGYCGWIGNGLETVGEVEEFFARMCFEIDQLLGEPAGCRWWLNWWDETPRDKIRLEMMGEVNRAIAVAEIKEMLVLTKKPKTFGRNPARRYFEKRARESGLKIIMRRGTVWWFLKNGPCNIVCMRYGRFLCRNIRSII